MVEQQFFTVAKTGSKICEFGEPTGYELEADEKKIVTLRFTLPLKCPAEARKPFTFVVYDPTFFIDFELEKFDPVTLVGAPAGCSLSTSKSDDDNDSFKLNESFASDLSPNANYGVKVVSPTVVACP